MKHLIFIVFILLVEPLVGQVFEGTILDSDGEPVAFASIGIMDHNIGTYSFEDGSFQLNLANSLETDTLTIRHIAYQSKRLLISDLDDQIVLLDKSVSLEEVIITPLRQARFGVFKKKSSSSIGIDLPYHGAEVGIAIKLPDQAVLAESLIVNIESNKLDSVVLRARIYQYTGKPDSLLFTSQTFKFPAKGGNVRLELRNPPAIKDSIFISFEWLVDKRIASIIYDHYQEKKKLIDSLQSIHNGAVTIFNQKKVVVTNSQGSLLNAFKLKKGTSKALKKLREETPQLRFRTTNEDHQTYYRSFAMGKWYPYPQTLVAGIEVSYLKTTK